MEPLNQAQLLLMRIGGTADLVAGVGGHYWADTQTPKKTRQRHRSRHYGRNLMAHFDGKRREAKKA